MKDLNKRFTPAEAEKLWHDKYCHFWYNSPEIFRWTQEDFDRKAAELHQAGITIVSTVGVTHFRFNYVPFWPQIVETIRKVAKACHKYNIQMVEHHSCSLIYHPRTETEWQRIRNYFETHFSSMEDFPGYAAGLTADPELEEGIKMSSMFQISGKTGLPVRTSYAGFAFCYNNPDYRRIYFKHLAAVRDAGVDCIMPDDIQYFGADNTCTCRHCRRLFKEQTGCDLPSPENWDDFFEHYDDPVFIKWLKFKQQSTVDFQKYVSDTLEKWGLDVYRSCYCSGSLAPNRTYHTFYPGRQYWKHIYQENTLAELIQLSFLRFYNESLQRYAMGRQLNVPSMSMFYPRNFSQYHFSWALCLAWGQLPYIGPQGFSMTKEDILFNTFEKKYWNNLFEQQKISDCAFLIPRESLNFTASMLEKSYYPLHALMQAAYFADLLPDALEEDEPLENFKFHKCIVAVGNTRVPASLIEKLQAFADNGGTLLVFGDFAIYDRPRGTEKLLASENVKQFACPWGEGDIQESISTAKFGTDMSRPAPPFKGDLLRNGPGMFLRSQLPAEAAVREITGGYHAYLYHQKKDPSLLTLHVLDMRDILVPEGTVVSQYDELKHFISEAPPNEAPVRITLSRSDIISAKLFSPFNAENVPIEVIQDHGTTALVIPPGSFAGYAFLELERASKN